MKDELTFGIEIECLAPIEWNRYESYSKIASLIKEAGIECQNESYNHSNRGHWKVTTDSSLTGNGMEIVSPILKGAQGQKDLVTVLSVLKKNKFTVNQSCGIHIHVGVPENADINFFKNLIRFYQEYEETIDQMMPRSRRESNNRFCRTIKDRNKSSIIKARTVNHLRSIFNHNRYYKLNLEPYWRQNTVEFRQHSGSLQGSKIISWLNIVLSMVQKAMDTNFPKEILNNGIDEGQLNRIEAPRRCTETNYQGKALAYFKENGANGVTNKQVNDYIGSKISLNDLLTSKEIPFYRVYDRGKYTYFLGTDPSAVQEELPAFVANVDTFCEYLGLDSLTKSYIIERIEELAA